MRKLWWSLIIAPFLALILVSVHVYILFNLPYRGEDKTFTIYSGEGFASINYRLKKDGLISNPRLFHYYARYNNVLGKFKSGTFTIKSGSDLTEVLDTLINGKPILFSLTIPEGKNIYDIAKIVAEAKLASAEDFLKEVKNKELIEKIDPTLDSLEGMLYPNTYSFDPPITAKSIVKMMLQEFSKRTSAIDFSQSKLSKKEVIILASIVEKETGASFERPIIAGVFHNRLKKGMRLQSDPTTIYGLYPNFTGNIKKDHLLQVTPYNTYMINGLPKGPICNPGEEAIKAVLNPAKHNYFFFVSKNDGTHIFSETYEQHNLSVEKFQLDRKNRQGKSWRNLKEKQK